MKPGPNNLSEPRPLLAFGAHPDDVEFGCGAVVSLETRAGRSAHIVVCSRGESASNGTPQQRTAEAEAGAASLGATIEFAQLDGDAHLEARSDHAITLAAIIRRTRPSIVLAPTPVPNQHPDHARLGALVRDAARLARYGGIKELADVPPHAIDQLLFYAVTSEGEPRDTNPILIDVSDPVVVAAWTAAMEAHTSQTTSRAYIELQLARSRLRGLSAGTGHAVALFPNDPIIVSSLSSITRAARAFWEVEPNAQPYPDHLLSLRGWGAESSHRPSAGGRPRPRVHFASYERPFRLPHGAPRITSIPLKSATMGSSSTRTALPLSVKMAEVCAHQPDVLHVHYAVPHATRRSSPSRCYRPTGGLGLSPRFTEPTPRCSGTIPAMARRFATP